MERFDHEERKRLAKKQETIKNFLKCDLNKLRVIELTDGEITLEFDGGAVCLYLDQDLNESEGFPKSFQIRRQK